MKIHHSVSLYITVLASSLPAQNFTSQVNIEYIAPTIHFKDNTSGHDNYWIRADNGNLYFLWDENDDGSWNSPHPLRIQGRSSYFYEDVLFVNGDLDRVGIGTVNPSRALQVTSPNSGYVLRLDIASNTVYHDALIEFSGRDSNNSGQRYGAFGAEIKSNVNGAENGDLWFSTASSADSGQTHEKMRLTSAGHLGIGTNNPAAEIAVVDSIVPQIALGSTNSNNGMRFEYHGNAQEMRIQASSTNGAYDSTAGTQMTIERTGNVGIGTTNPTHKLSVNGTIRAKEVIVESGWSDYVFEDDYRLAPLAEVEAHITAHGHLPGIPSATESEQNGAKLSELVTLQMAKIEELTLHLIEKEKQLEAERHKNENQAADLADLRRSQAQQSEQLSNILSLLNIEHN